MKHVMITGVLFLMLFTATAQEQLQASYEYRMFTTIESVISGGLGRSKMLETASNGQMIETELEHLFSIGGIHMKNINSNDGVITKKINDYAAEGWELQQIAPGVYSRDGGSGIFLTRYFFRRAIK